MIKDLYYFKKRFITLAVENQEARGRDLYGIIGKWDVESAGFKTGQRDRNARIIDVFFFFQFRHK